MSFGLIPRLYPSYTFKELLFSLSAMLNKKTRPRFERQFAEAFGVKYVYSLAYGRSGLYFFLKAMGIEGKEVILPAYTCEVVAAAIVYSGNIPRFVEICPEDFNMTLESIRAAVNENTAVVLATHIYGIPMKEPETLHTFCKEKNIFLVQDCALAPFSTYEGKPVYTWGDGAIFSFSSGKIFSTIEGGVFSTDNAEIAAKMQTCLETHAAEVTLFGQLREFIFGLALLVGLHPYIYRYTLLLDRLKLLNFATRIFSETKIQYPAQGMKRLSRLKARLGIFQLKKLERVLARNREIVQAYLQAPALPARQISRLADMIRQGAVLSHFPLLVKDRQVIIRRAKKRGIHLGKELFDYCIPCIGSYGVYEKYQAGESFPAARQAAAEILLLPIHRKMKPGYSGKMEKGWFQ